MKKKIFQGKRQHLRRAGLLEMLSGLVVLAEQGKRKFAAFSTTFCGWEPNV